MVNEKQRSPEQVATTAGLTKWRNDLLEFYGLRSAIMGGTKSAFCWINIKHLHALEGMHQFRQTAIVTTVITVLLREILSNVVIFSCSHLRGLTLGKCESFDQWGRALWQIRQNRANSWSQHIKILITLENCFTLDKEIHSNTHTKWFHLKTEHSTDFMVTHLGKKVSRRD